MKSRFSSVCMTLTIFIYDTLGTLDVYNPILAQPETVEPCLQKVPAQYQSYEKCEFQCDNPTDILVPVPVDTSNDYQVGSKYYNIETSFDVNGCGHDNSLNRDKENIGNSPRYSITNAFITTDYNGGAVSHIGEENKDITESLYYSCHRGSTQSSGHCLMDITDSWAMGDPSHYCKKQITARYHCVNKADWENTNDPEIIFIEKESGPTPPGDTTELDCDEATIIVQDAQYCVHNDNGVIDNCETAMGSVGFECNHQHSCQIHVNDDVTKFAHYDAAQCGTNDPHCSQTVRKADGLDQHNKRRLTVNYFCVGRHRKQTTEVHTDDQCQNGDSQSYNEQIWNEGVVVTEVQLPDCSDRDATISIRSAHWYATAHEFPPLNNNALPHISSICNGKTAGECKFELDYRELTPNDPAEGELKSLQLAWCCLTPSEAPSQAPTKKPTLSYEDRCNIVYSGMIDEGVLLDARTEKVAVNTENCDYFIEFQRWSKDICDDIFENSWSTAYIPDEEEDGGLYRNVLSLQMAYHCPDLCRYHGEMVEQWSDDGERYGCVPADPNMGQYFTTSRSYDEMCLSNTNNEDLPYCTDVLDDPDQVEIGVESEKPMKMRKLVENEK